MLTNIIEVYILLFGYGDKSFGGTLFILLKQMRSQMKDVVNNKKIITVSKMHILQCMGSKFCVKLWCMSSKFNKKFEPVHRNIGIL